MAKPACGPQVQHRMEGRHHVPQSGLIHKMAFKGSSSLREKGSYAIAYPKCTCFYFKLLYITHIITVSTNGHSYVSACSVLGTVLKAFREP